MPSHPSDALAASAGWETSPQSFEISARVSPGSAGCSRLAGNYRTSPSAPSSYRCQSYLFRRACGLVFGCRWMASGTGCPMPAISVLDALCLFGSALPACFFLRYEIPSPPGRRPLDGEGPGCPGLGARRELTLRSLPGPPERRPCFQRWRATSPWRLNLLEGVKMMGSSRWCDRSVVRRSAPRCGTVWWKLELCCGPSS